MVKLQTSLLSVNSIVPKESKDELFKKYAESYDKVVAKTSFYKKLIKDAVENLKECKNVVDLGCATGNLTIELAKRGVNVLAVDSNPAMIKKVQEKVDEFGLNSYVTVMCEELEKFPFSKNLADGFALLNVVYLLEKPFDILDKIYSSLETEGILVVSGPKPDQQIQLLTQKMLQELKSVDEKDIEIVRKVNQVLSKHQKHFFSTQRISEILLDFVGFSELITNDLIPKYQTYLGQGHFVAVKKTTDFKNLDLNKIKIRFPNSKEIETLYKIRYNTIKERLNVINTSKQQNLTKTEYDQFDQNSIYFIAEYQNKILASIRFVKDSNYDGLPIDNEYDINDIRKQGHTVWEPGRWISLPFAPKGTGRQVLRAGFEYAKSTGVTRFASLINMESKNLYEKMGFKLDTVSKKDVKGYKTKAFVEIFSSEDPPRFFKEEITHSVSKFIETFKLETISASVKN